MSEQNNLIAGRYELLELIGRGGMGDVFKGRDQRTGDLVAIKALHQHIVSDNPDIVDRFRREGEALRQLDHPNIVKLLDTVEENDRHYLVMEYVSGGSLRDLMDDQGQLPIDAVLNVALDLADALTRAHRMNVIHRDIKPDNVLLAEDGTPRLTDFGVAHMGDRTRLTETGSVIGTYAYLSPEACEGQELDARTDIWSFGIMLFEMIAGRPPFQAAGTAAILTAILNKPAPDLKRLRPSTPDALVNLIRQMLEKNRNHRIGSVRLVGAEIEAIIRGQDTPLRNALRQAGVGPGALERHSRFATPTDDGEQRPHIPAMMSTPEGQEHGFSDVYPPKSSPPTLLSDGYIKMTPAPPGQTPPTASTSITGEYPPGSNLRWIALIAVVLITAVAAVLIVAIISGAVSDSTGGERSAPPLAPTATIEPVAAGEYMVLVAALEPLGVEPRDVSRFIVDNLRQELEQGVSFSTARIRAYPEVITSEEQAHAAAQAAGATVVIWGSYTADAIQLDVQIGVTNAFPRLVLPLEQVARVANVRVTMTDERRESVAQQVLGVLAALHGGSGDVYEFMRTLAIMAEIESPDAEPVGANVAAYTHRYFAGYSQMSPDEIDLIEQAIAEDAANPLLYALQAVAFQRKGDFSAAQRAAETAARIGPSNWVVPMVIAAISSESPQDALSLFDQVVQLRPDDWYAYASRGTIFYLMHDYEHALADFQQSIALGPDANFPYALAGLIEMASGDFPAAFGYIQVILSQFPDPDLYARIVGATVGNHDTFGPLVSAFVNMTLGRYEAVLRATQTGIERIGPSTDLLMMQGLAYCNLNQPAEAEQVYSQVIALNGADSPDNAFALVLRGDVRLQQANRDGAQSDFAQSETFGVLPPLLIDLFRTGQANCKNYVALMSMGGASGTPADTSAAESTPPPLVEPIAPGEVMVLVARLENLGSIASLAGHNRDVTGVLIENLKTTLEDTVPFSTIRVRAYPKVITSDAEAMAAAEAVGAAVVVWGNVSSDLIEIEVQVGDLRAFPYMAFERRVLERTVNVRLRLADAREPIAPQVLGVLQVLEMADGSAYETMRINAVQAALEPDLSSSGASAITGNSVAANVQRFLAMVVENPAGALEALDSALAVDAGNPLLYGFRALALQRMGRFEESLREIESAERTGPAEWAMPLMLRANITHDESVIDLFDRVLTLRPDDWFPLFFRGTVYYSLGQMDRAEADLQAAIALEPTANFPYVYRALLALRAGEWAEASAMLRIIVQEFPDPSYMERLITATFGDKVPSPYDLLLSAFTYQALGRYDQALEQATQGAALFSGMADFRLLQGVAQCTLGKNADAEISLTRAIDYDPSLVLARLLRASIRLADDRSAGAEQDLEAVLASAQGASFAAQVEMARAGRLDCAALFDPDSPIYHPGTQEGGEVRVPAASDLLPEAVRVEPVEPDQIMILVADFGTTQTGLDAGRFVADNLARAFEDEVPNSTFFVRRYPLAIGSDAEARAAAELNEAPVIVWGSTSGEVAEVNVQVGTLARLPYLRLDRATIERSANVTVRLADVRIQSVAPQVAHIFNLLTAADGDEISFYLTLAIVDMIEVEPGEMVGETPAVAMHRALDLITADPAAATAALDEAIALDSANPLPYIYRALIAMRIENTPRLLGDLDMARKLGPQDWTAPLYISMGLMTLPSEVLGMSERLVKLRPNDWYTWETRALARYYLSSDLDFEAIQRDLAQAIALHPTVGTPYLFSALVSLRQGHIADGQAAMHTILREYPDPQILNRAMRALYGVETNDFRAMLVAYGTNLMLGRTTETAAEIAQITGSNDFAALRQQADALGITMNDASDMLLLGGLAQCMQGQVEEAAVTFGAAQQLTPDYALLAVLRAQVLARAGDMESPAQQWALAAEHSYGPAFDPWLRAAQVGDWTCDNFFDYQPPE